MMQPPPHQYQIGETAIPSDIDPSPIHNTFAAIAAASLVKGDGAFILRSDGTWRFAVVAAPASESGPKNAYVDFIVGSDRSTKRIGRYHWGARFRPLRPTAAAAARRSTSSLKEQKKEDEVKEVEAKKVVNEEMDGFRHYQPVRGRHSKHHNRVDTEFAAPRPHRGRHQRLHNVRQDSGHPSSQHRNSKSCSFITIATNDTSEERILEKVAAGGESKKQSHSHHRPSATATEETSPSSSTSNSVVIMEHALEHSPKISHSSSHCDDEDDSNNNNQSPPRYEATEEEVAAFHQAQRETHPGGRKERTTSSLFKNLMTTLDLGGDLDLPLTSGNRRASDTDASGVGGRNAAVKPHFSRRATVGEDANPTKAMSSHIRKKTTVDDEEAHRQFARSLVSAHRQVSDDPRKKLAKSVSPGVGGVVPNVTAKPASHRRQAESRPHNSRTASGKPRMLHRSSSMVTAETEPSYHPQNVIVVGKGLAFAPTHTSEEDADVGIPTSIVIALGEDEKEEDE
ncbi:predicted protein [Thalassiosira pseudonana CCMP1335]|uniref:Uncharacterized protein n=1 Tax=Thalassiosira pseudonana TaxID=35128 RepID=B8C5S7_THAPS|nr:predicted protein [Thalassiosira pseudonana CCMP1335]EED91555.1 predicted protein [Thalassiosira pseudonana CCMP1335]